MPTEGRSCTTCCIPACGKTSQTPQTSFHKFPSSHKQNWLEAIQNHYPDRYNNRKSHQVCSSHFEKDDFVFLPTSKRPRLKHDAIPSVFPLPLSCKPKTIDSFTTAKHDHKYVEKLEISTVQNLKNKLSKSKQQLRHLKIQNLKLAKKINSINEVIEELQTKFFINNNTADILRDNFAKLPMLAKELFDSEITNIQKKNHGQRFSEDIKRFALTVHYYSPKAYDYLKSIFILPSVNSLSNWASAVNCNPGLFSDVFMDLQSKSRADANFSDCALLFDGMSIKSKLGYNTSEDNYDGLVNLGPNINAPKKIASEAIVFMLVGLRKNWKTPIGYVLANGLSAVNLKTLILEILQTAHAHQLKIRTITCDGLSTNIDCLKQLGIKIDITRAS